MSHCVGILKGGPNDDDDSPPSQRTGVTEAMTHSTVGLNSSASGHGALSSSAAPPNKMSTKIKRVKSSDMLRMKINEMMFDAEEKEKKAEADHAAARAIAEAELTEQKAKFYAEAADQRANFDVDRAADKAKADEDRAADKAKADAEKEYLRARINELRSEVQSAEQAKLMSDAKLRSVSSTNLSHNTVSTVSEERLQKQVDDFVEERKALEEKIAAMQADIEAAAETKEAAKAKSKVDRDAAARMALEAQVNELRREVEEAAFSKYLIGQELEEAKRMSSDSNSSNDNSAERVAEMEKQLQDMIASKKAGYDAGAAREAKLEADAVEQKEAGDAREKELQDRLAALLEEVDDATFKKLESDEKGRSLKEGLQQQILALQMEVQSAMSAKKKSDDEKDAALLAKTQAVSAKDTAVLEKDAAVSAKIKSDFDKDTAVSELDKMKESSSNEDSSEEVSDLRKQLFKMKAKNNDLRTERALIESFAIAREEEDRDEMDRALEEKEQQVEVLRAEMQSVVTAKLEAEKARDMAVSETMSSVTGFTDEHALALQIELEELLKAKEAAEEDAAARGRELDAAVTDMKAKRKADQDTGAAKEKELEDQMDSLLEKTHEAKSRKLISDGEHRVAMDEANAKEDQLLKWLKFLQEEVESAVFQKHLADEALGKMKSSASSQSGSSDSPELVSRLKASEDLIQALKEAAAKNKTDKDVEMKASLDEVQALKDVAAKEKVDRDTELKYPQGETQALKDAATKNKADRDVKLKASQDEIWALKDAAAREKSDRDKEKADNDFDLKASQDEIKVLKDTAAKAKAVSKKEHKAEIDEQQEKLVALKSEVDSAVFAKFLAESEMDLLGLCSEGKGLAAAALISRWLSLESDSSESAESNQT